LQEIFVSKPLHHYAQKTKRIPDLNVSSDKSMAPCMVRQKTPNSSSFQEFSRYTVVSQVTNRDVNVITMIEIVTLSPNLTSLLHDVRVYSSTEKSIVFSFAALVLANLT
jgi:hypothetical protein